MTADRFDLVVTGDPRGQMRAGRGPRGFSFPQKEQVEYEERIGNVWLSVGMPRLPVRAPYVVKVTAVHERPPTHYNTKGELNAEGRRRPFPGKPDIDNCIKQIDCLVKCGALPDDVHMIACHGSKRWADEGERAHMRIEARTLLVRNPAEEG